MADIFISYSSQEHDLTQTLAEFFEGHGFFEEKTIMAKFLGFTTGFVGSLSAMFLIHAAHGQIQISQSSVDPPFVGAASIAPDFINSSDPTTFQVLTLAGQGTRTMFDRFEGFNAPGSSPRLCTPGLCSLRTDWPGHAEFENVYIFEAKYADDQTDDPNDHQIIEILVNPEFGDEAAARQQADKYAPIIGRLPFVLRKDIKEVMIHKSDHNFTGGHGYLVIYTDRSVSEYEPLNTLEETLLHEDVHNSFTDSLTDPETQLNNNRHEDLDWLDARKKDVNFITTYAMNTVKEDMAESFLAYLILSYRPDRITDSIRDTINATIPARIAYFDKDFSPTQYPNMFPQASDSSGNDSSSSDSSGNSSGNSFSLFDLSKYYHLKTQLTGDDKCLDIINNLPTMTDCGNFSGQLWSIQTTTEQPGSYQLKTQFTGDGSCMDIINDQPEMKDCGDFSGQYWDIEFFGGDSGFRLKAPFLGENRCLEIVDDETDSQLRVADCSDTYDGQRWLIEEGG